MRILVVGGTRFIGPRVVRLLAEHSHDVTVLHRGSTPAQLPPNVSEIKAERRALPSVIRDFRAAIDVVLDMICMTEQDSRELVNACRAAVGRVVVLSSMDVYWNYGAFTRLESGDPLAGPMREESPLRTVLYPYRAQSKSKDDLTYHYEKILVERTAMSDPALQATILRLAAVYGPGDHRCFDYLKRMTDGRPKILLGKTASSWRWSRGYVDDIAETVALAVTDAGAAGRIYNVGEPDALTESDWARAIGEAAEWKGEVVVVPDEALPDHLKTPYDFRHHLCGDTTRFRTELGFTEGLSRAEALRRTVEWERSNFPVNFDASCFNYEAEDAAIAAAGLTRAG